MPILPAASTPKKEKKDIDVSISKFSEKKLYDLSSLLDLSLSLNPSTRNAWYQANAASAAIGEARSPYFPHIKAAFEGGFDKWYTPAANAPDNFQRRQATFILSLEYILLDFGRRSADVQRTLAMFDAANFIYQRKIQQVVFEVQRAYFAYEASLWRLEAAEAFLLAARASAETIKKELDAGLSASPEWLRAKKNVLEAEYELETARSRMRNDLGNLCVVTGIPANSPLRITPSDPPPSTGALRKKADNLIQLALKDRPDLAARVADIRTREASVKRAKADFLPEVSIEGNLATSAFGYNARAAGTHGSYQENLQGYGAFLVAKWDVFDGFDRVAKLAKNQAEEKASRENLLQAQLDASRDVWTAYNDTASAATRVDYSESFLISAQENFASMKSAFEVGLATISEFSEASAQLAYARASRATAFAEYSTSLAALAYATGWPLLSEKQK